MTYEVWSPLFLGMVFALLLTNSVQWLMYRERIYGLYSICTLTWSIYFIFTHFSLPYTISNFAKLVLSYTGLASSRIGPGNSLKSFFCATFD